MNINSKKTPQSTCSINFVGNPKAQAGTALKARNVLARIRHLHRPWQGTHFHRSGPLCAPRAVFAAGPPTCGRNNVPARRNGPPKHLCGLNAFPRNKAQLIQMLKIRGPHYRYQDPSMKRPFRTSSDWSKYSPTFFLLKLNSKS